MISLRSSRFFSIFQAGKSRERVTGRAKVRAWGEQRLGRSGKGVSEKGEQLGEEKAIPSRALKRLLRRRGV